MKRQPTSGPRIHRFLGRVSLLLGGLGSFAACTEYATYRNLPTDCSAEEGYEFDPLNAFEKASDANFWIAGDPFCGDTDAGIPRSLSLAVSTMPDGPRCGSKMGLVFRSAQCNDWGALAGYNNFGPQDKHLWEGISFWARSPGNTGKSFTIVLDDANTAASAPSSHCREYDAGAGGQTTTFIDPATGQPMSGGLVSAAQPDQCGNSYNAIIPITGEWRFYTVPFSAFTQTAQPNRVPNAILQGGTVPGNGLLTSALQTFIIRVPKEEPMELWLDNLGFYRKRIGGTGTGLDAAAK
jgi:hypothetical protein